MMRGFLWGSGILLVALLIFVFWDRGDESQRSPVPQEEHVPAQAPALPEQTTPDIIPEEEITPPPPPPAPLATEESSSSVVEGKQSAADAIALARQFLLNFETVLVHIGKVRAIREGRYLLKEGETEPNLPAEFAALVNGYADLRRRLPTEGGFVESLTKIYEQAQDLISGLSKPPSLEELMDADEIRKDIQKEISNFALSLQ